MERIGESDGPMGASLQITTGFAHQQRGDFDQALACYERALALREALFGSRHPGVAIAYQHIGLTQYSRERRDEAREAFQRTLDIDVDLYGEDHATVAHARDALGVLLSEQGEYDEALEMLEKARATRARAFGEESVWVAQSLHNIGNVWLGRGRPREALDHYERSTALLGKLRGPDHPDRVLGLCNVGLSQSRLGDHEAAIVSFREALRIQEAALGPDHPETARVLVFLGCDGAKPAAEVAKADVAPSKAGDDEAIAKRKAAREAEAKQKEEEAAALAAKIDALAVLPEDVPKSLHKACAQMTKAYDGYMRKVLKGDMLTKWETGGNEMQISIFDRECKTTTPKIAACQAHALEAMPVELEKELATVMKRCAEKHAGG